MNGQGAHVGRVLLAVAASIYFFSCAQHPEMWHFIDAVDLIIHEAGHVVFMPFGDFLHILGGSLFQVLVPLIFSAYFYLRGQGFSGSIVLFWVGQSLINVSVYAGDAIAMQLPLLGGDGVEHDWHAILTMLNALPQTAQIAHIMYGFGFGLIAIAAMGSLYFSWFAESVEGRRERY